MTPTLIFVTADANPDLLPQRAQRVAEEDPLKINEVSGVIVDAAMEVHTALGPGLLESAYEACLTHELRSRGHDVQNQVEQSIHYKGICIELGYRMDMLVNRLVVVEVKAVAKLLPIHEAQLLSYLKLNDHKVGLLINFNVLHLRDGLKRLVNNL